MAEFDDKLNSLLSNPDAMSQIMQLAQSLGGGGSQSPPPQQPAPGWTPPPQSPPNPGWNPQGQAGPQPPPAGDFLSSLAGGMDPKLISRLLPLIQELGGQRDSNARNLLYALRPYLKTERQDKIERALQLARLFHLGRKFLSGWEGRVMYNRYIRSDDGTYTRIPEEETPQTGTPSHGHEGQQKPSPENREPPQGQPAAKDSSGPSHHGGPQSTGPSPDGQGWAGGPPPGGQGWAGGPPPGGQGWAGGARPADGLSGFLRHLLDQLHMDHVDTGDMLLLILLFFLFREEADEELLVALGLLLIL